MNNALIATNSRLPNAGALLIAQIRYQARLLLSSGRALAVGVGLPVILLIASKGKAGHPNVTGYAVFGVTVTAWSTYGVRLVAAREAGILKRWRATPLPRWCYFAGNILATTLLAAMAGAAAVLAADLIYGSHFDQGPAVHLTGEGAGAIAIVLILGGLAWSATATALTRLIPTVDAAFPILILTYFPIIIISGVLFAINEPHWLSSLASDLPAEPMIDAIKRAVRHTPGQSFLRARDLIVLASWAAAGLLAALAVFRWEPHRPAQRRGARA
jgi:ABC-2 type transport system permease protein